MRRAGSGTGRTLADGNPVRAKRALIGFVIDLGETRDVERTSLDAIAASLEYCTIAPGAGHAFKQPGSSQCMQPSLRISHSRSPLSFSHSVKRIKVQVPGSRSEGLS